MKNSHTLIKITPRPNGNPQFPFVIGNKFTPHLAKMIWQHMDQNTLAKCQMVSKVLKNFTDTNSPLWGKISRTQYCDVAEEGRLDLCRLIIQHAEDKNST